MKKGFITKKLTIKWKLPFERQHDNSSTLMAGLKKKHQLPSKLSGQKMSIKRSNSDKEYEANGFSNEQSFCSESSVQIKQEVDSNGTCEEALLTSLVPKDHPFPSSIDKLLIESNLAEADESTPVILDIFSLGSYQAFSRLDVVLREFLKELNGISLPAHWEVMPLDSPNLTACLEHDIRSKSGPICACPFLNENGPAHPFFPRFMLLGEMGKRKLALGALNEEMISVEEELDSYTRMAAVALTDGLPSAPVGTSITLSDQLQRKCLLSLLGQTI
ncbi:hypothetical protein NDU88_005225 [Pleurodeles waltl]|uniref:Uncharacterized protein n=1 Tax=Pleurodeles waltl TaxID=8319 RepID=A0AAV7TTN5_PLEWA|nr:hypothetical protein NDU88_005225 [Pleurodeles waltl]